MGYCTAADVRAMLRDETVIALLSDEYIEDAAQREARILPLIETAIRDADGEVDGYLAKRYAVPLSNPPAVIVGYAKDIALYRLFGRIGIDEQGRDKTYLTRYKYAVDFLRLVAEGKVELGVSTGADTAAPAGGMHIRSAPRVFSRRSLRGM